MRKIKVGDRVKSSNEADKFSRKIVGKVVAIEKRSEWPIEVKLDNSLNSGLYYEHELEVLDEENADI